MFEKLLAFLSDEGWAQERRYIAYAELKKLLARLIAISPPVVAQTTTTTTTADPLSRPLLIEMAQLGGGESDDAAVAVHLSAESEAAFAGWLRGELAKVAEFYASERRRLFDACEDELRRTTTNAAAAAASGEDLRARHFALAAALCALQDFARINAAGFARAVAKLARKTDSQAVPTLQAECAAAEFASPAAAAALESLGERLRTGFARAIAVAEEEEDADQIAQQLEERVAAARKWRSGIDSIGPAGRPFQQGTKAAEEVKAKPGSIKIVPIVLALVALAVLMFAPIMPSHGPAQRCLAILVCAMVLWVSEAVPFFVTALLAALLVAISYVLCDIAGSTLAPSEAVAFVMSKMFPTPVPLILCSVSISTALRKYGLDRKLSLAILDRPLFNSPRRFILGVELLTFFVSMWISSVAGSVLVISLIRPIIDALPRRSTYIKAMLMAVALGGDIGASAAQTGSSQSSVTTALGEYSVDFLRFSTVSLPTCPFLLASAYFLIVRFFPVDVAELPPAQLARVDRHQDSPKLGWQPICVIVVSLCTICLWTASHWLVPFGKSIGTVSLISVVALYGSGLLAVRDFRESMPWPLLYLLSGGSVLGAAVESSKLLELMANGITALPGTLFGLSMLCALVMAFVSCFIAHTIAALVLLPLSVKVGAALGHPQLLVMTSVITCNGSVPLPISSIPNMTAHDVRDAKRGEHFLTTRDFLKVGIVQTVFAFLLACTVGFGMALLVGF